MVLRELAKKNWKHAVVGALALVLVSAATVASAQVKGLYYREEVKDGRIYVFNTYEKYQQWKSSGEMGVSITLIGRGPDGETVIAENDVAVDLYLFKHNLASYDRPAPPPAAAPSAPSALKVADGELKFGLLLQSWYVGDDSPASTGSSWLGNTTGYNTFRLRRAEIKLNGKITPNWGFEVMLDPSKGQSFDAGKDSKLLQDLAVTYIGLKGHEFALGQKKIYLTEEGVRSSSELDFAERAQATRTFSDQRQTGLFYKGELSELVTAYASVTNGVPSNVNSNTNDTLFYSARFDFKPASGFILGVSGASGNTASGKAHLGVKRYAAHLKYDGTAELPIGFRAEYVSATDEQGTGKADLKRDGYYGTILYTIEKQYQFAVRYDVLDNNKDVSGNKTTMVTAGFHYLVKGKNINVKFDFFDIKQEGRKVNGVLAEKYRQAVLAAQVAF